MQYLVRRACGVLAFLLFAALAGCASFPGEKLKGSMVPDTSSKPYRPTAYVEVKFFQGKPGTGTPVEMPAVKPIAQAAVEKVLKADSPFSRYSFDPFDQDKMDYVAELHYYNHGDVGSAAVLGIITGLTFGVIPSAATDKYTLVTTVTEKKMALAPPQHSDDSITTWLGLWFLPLAGKTPEKAAMATFEDLARDGLRKIVVANQLRFTPPEPPVAAAPASAPAGSDAAAATGPVAAPVAAGSPPAAAPSPQQ